MIKQSKSALSARLDNFKNSIGQLQQRASSIEARIQPDRPQQYTVTTLNELDGVDYLLSGDVVLTTMDMRTYMYINNDWLEFGVPMYVVATPDLLPVDAPAHTLGRCTEGVYAGRMYFRNVTNTGWSPANFLGDPL